MNRRLVELEEQTRVKVGKLEMEISQKDALIEQLNTQVAQLLGQSVATPDNAELETLVKQYQAQIAAFDQEKEKYLGEITELNQKVNKLQVEMQNSASASEKLQPMQEQLGVYQEMIKQLEDEKRELSEEVRALKEAQGGASEQDEQLGVYQEMIKQLEDENRELSQEVTALKGTQGGATEVDEQLGVYQEMIKQLEDEKRELEKQLQESKTEVGTGQDEELEALKQNVTELKEEKNALEEKMSEIQKENATLNSDIQNFGALNENLEAEKERLLQKVQALESQSQTQATSQQELDQLKIENQKLTTEIDNLNRELDELMKINRDQTARITQLEADLVAATAAGPAPSVPAAPSAPTAQPVSAPTQAAPRTAAGGVRNFGFADGNFVETSGKSAGINLELDENSQTWTLTIEPGTGFLQKNQVLRAARSITISGLKASDGSRLGKGYELKVIGEY